MQIQNSAHTTWGYEKMLLTSKIKPTDLAHNSWSNIISATSGLSTESIIDHINLDIVERFSSYLRKVSLGEYSSFKVINRVFSPRMILLIFIYFY